MATKLFIITDPKGVAYLPPRKSRRDFLFEGDYITDDLVNGGSFTKEGLAHMESIGRIKSLNEDGLPSENKKMPKASKKKGVDPVDSKSADADPQASDPAPESHMVS